ncbi:K+/H+ antiporter subunit F [Paracoccus sp. S-4012]|uniref:K+/H+ antiporter subunit F n=1 Tax=Paracoccus sp. S-4012 TaxID=2665648 RepID=UPI0012B157B3|nr:K+/H+ antiporter subunit F [Paracoccus sp. S-4012]MRX51933.1 K+/H+ antiporter subunit F [Paracoccus sp. S-4012]
MTTQLLVNIALGFAAVCYAIALLLNAWRILRPRDVPDRVLALDTLTVNAIALIVLAGIWTGRLVVFEVAILFAMTGFIGTVAYSRFLLRGDIIE